MPGWDPFSRAYRAEKDNRCESCGIQLQGENTYYLDPHHIDKDRRNNEKSNLRVLCVLCHANQQGHQHMLQHKRVAELKGKFASALKKCNNPYI